MYMNIELTTFEEKFAFIFVPSEIQTYQDKHLLIDMINLMTFKVQGEYACIDFQTLEEILKVEEYRENDAVVCYIDADDKEHKVVLRFGDIYKDEAEEIRDEIIVGELDE